MSELLSAASLLLAIVGVVYGLWYPEITAALTKEYPTFKEDRKKHIKDVDGVLVGRAFPLSISSLALSIVFFPDAIRITLESSNNLFSNGISALTNYSAVNTAFCLVVIFAVAIASHAIYLTCKLIILRKSLKKE